MVLASVVVRQLVVFSSHRGWGIKLDIFNSHVGWDIELHRILTMTGAFSLLVMRKSARTLPLRKVKNVVDVNFSNLPSPLNRTCDTGDLASLDNVVGNEVKP